ncbi:molybdopterin-dependent oxidoreductase, partial [Stenotrophomonas maltophilia]|uniref:molybdopterin-dependent oxidoreductase n=1 Tax=Stenotrophomonas maltophilia TaxID=40324 RepID=UPI00215B07E9
MNKGQVYALLLAQCGVDRGCGGGNGARGFDDMVPGTPAWQERITGVSRAEVIEIAREFARTADKTHGRSTINVGAGPDPRVPNHTNYRGPFNTLIMCGRAGPNGVGRGASLGPGKLA